MEEPQKIGIPRTHPDFKKNRRERFCRLLREAHKILKADLSEEERESVKALYQQIESKHREAGKE